MATRIGLALALVTSFVAPASAYTLQTGFSDSCHERLTVKAVVELLLQVPPPQLVLPDGTWDELAQRLLPPLLRGDLFRTNPEVIARFEEDPVVRFFILSVVLGVRAPDTSGHSVSDLNALRRIHADPSAIGQYKHSLRAPADDGLLGDLSAINGTHDVIREYVDQYVEAVSKPPSERIIEAELYLDFYDAVPLPVWEPFYILGQAIHAIQDAHSHTIRSADGAYVYSVLNYTEALTGELSVNRDGMPHSDGLDDCHGPIEVLVNRATATSRSLVIAAAGAAEGNWTRLETGLSACPEGETARTDCGWITYKPDCDAALIADDANAIERSCCTQANDFCGTPWLSIAEEGQTGPYLPSCECRIGRDSDTDACSAGLGYLAILALCAARRRPPPRPPLRRRPGHALRPMTGALLLTLGLAGSWTENAHARENEAFAALELHGSSLSDSSNHSLINVSFGYALRGGYRFGAWGATLIVERNYWVSTEFNAGVRPGVLNLGVGGEYIYGQGYLRTAVALGTSTLRYATPLDDSGTTGVYAELRMVGLRWEPGEHTALSFDPLTLTMLRPVTHAPVLRLLQYRTVVGIEGRY